MTRGYRKFDSSKARRLLIVGVTIEGAPVS